MKNYEIIKEAKIAYEYINDLLSNGDFEIGEDSVEYLKKSMNALGDMYENTYHLMFTNRQEEEILKTDLNCPCCNTKNLYISDLIHYAYVCVRCDENYYLCEGDLNHEWYFDNNRKLEINEKSEDKKYSHDIYKVTKEELNQYIEDWHHKDTNKYKYELLYCEDDGRFIAVDNCSGDCWTEDFETEAQAVFWLNSDEDVAYIPFSIIPKRIVERVIDTTINKNNYNDDTLKLSEGQVEI